jgi:hypothetical protein
MSVYDAPGADSGTAPSDPDVIDGLSAGIAHARGRSRGFAVMDGPFSYPGEDLRGLSLPPFPGFTLPVLLEHADLSGLLAERQDREDRGDDREEREDRGRDGRDLRGRDEGHGRSVRP